MTMSGKKTKLHYLGAMYFDDEYQEKKRIWAEEEAAQAAMRPAIFSARYKHYAAWPVVLWCRLRHHVGQGFFWSGAGGRCIRCGDLIAKASGAPARGDDQTAWRDQDSDMSHRATDNPYR